MAKKILLGITGSIAAYKSVALLRLLTKQNADVKVIMTPAAKDFVSPLVINTFSNNACFLDLVHNNQWQNHVSLSQWADLFVVAPLSCNTLAKMANGLCDNLLLSCFFSATCPIMLFPAMEENMWKNPITQKNKNTLQTLGIKIFDVAHGDLASKQIGDGRMQEPQQILQHINAFFTP